MGLEMIGVFRKEKGITLEELSEKSGVPVSTIKKISAGITTDPNLSTIQAIASALGCTVDDLSNSSPFAETFSAAEKKHIKKYRALDGYGKEAVDAVLDVEYKRYIDWLESRKAAKKADMEAAVEMEPDNILYMVPHFISSMSAGTGDPAGDGEWENLGLTREPPRGTSYVAKVDGDSMEPTLPDGALVFVRAVERINIGEIGVFFMGGCQWVKELGDGELISHNPEYDPVPMTEDIRCQGKVLGICDESYFA